MLDMLNCKQSSQLISQSLDRSLTLRERFALNLHLLICKFCKQFSQQLQTLYVAVKQVASSIENDHTIEMPHAAKERITKLVEANAHNHNN